MNVVRENFVIHKISKLFLAYLLIGSFIYVFTPIVNASSQSAETADEPNLTIPTKNIYISPSRIFTIPVDLTTGGHNLSSTGFDIDYSGSCLSFSDAKDSSGLYEAIQGEPTSVDFVTTAEHNDNDSELDIKIYDNTDPVNTYFENGTLLSIEFEVKSSCVITDGTTASVDFKFTNESDFGNNEAGDVTGTLTNGTYTLYFNSWPTDIDLSSHTIDENDDSNAVVGVLSTTDPDLNKPITDPNVYTYTIVPGPSVPFEIVASSTYTAN